LETWLRKSKATNNERERKVNSLGLTHEQLMHESLSIYEKTGQFGLISWADEIGIKEWKWCEPCEFESPISENACLVCWTIIK
jgi:hypothetical protein